MEFEQITDMAYRKDELPNSSSILEQLIWHKMVLIYQDYNKKAIDIDESIKRKEKLKSFFIMQKRLENFYKDLHDERYKNIRECEDMLKELQKAEENEVSEKELLKMCIDYISKITGIIPIKTLYTKHYEVK